MSELDKVIDKMNKQFENIMAMINGINQSLQEAIEIGKTYTEMEEVA
jgi:hypothetical protein